jgi:hypothetical protein
MASPQNKWGQRWQGTLFGKKAIRDALVEMLNCFYNLTYRVKTRSSDGVSTIISTGDIKLGPLGGVVEFDLTNLSANGAGGGLFEEYNPTHSYVTGDYFIVSTARVVAGIAVVAGFYGVPVATPADVNGLPWAGFVPANPTANAVPQSPLPSLGAAPNNVFYAKLIMPFC